MLTLDVAIKRFKVQYYDYDGNGKLGTYNAILLCKNPVPSVQKAKSYQILQKKAVYIRKGYS